jgi:hypothetical protein
MYLHHQGAEMTVRLFPRLPASGGRRARRDDTPINGCSTMSSRTAAYWKTHIATHPYFNSECECLVVFILNTRRRIKGHYLVSIGTMDTILCHPREVFRLAIMASAAAIIIAHNLCAATHKLCYVECRFMWSRMFAARAPQWILLRKDGHATQ